MLPEAMTEARNDAIVATDVNGSGRRLIVRYEITSFTEITL